MNFPVDKKMHSFSMVDCGAIHCMQHSRTIEHSTFNEPRDGSQSGVPYRCQLRSSGGSWSTCTSACSSAMRSSRKAQSQLRSVVKLEMHQSYQAACMPHSHPSTTLNPYTSSSQLMQHFEELIAWKPRIVDRADGTSVQEQSWREALELFKGDLYFPSPVAAVNKPKAFSVNDGSRSRAGDT